MTDGPTLLAVNVPDTAAAWSAAGFSITSDGEVSVVDLGGIFVRLEQPQPETSWLFLDDGRLSGDEVADGSLDGIRTERAARTEVDTTTPPGNPNGVMHLDHVVMISPSLPRTVPRLEAAGFEVRRRRDIPKGRQQVFLWAGPTIIELVGPVDATATLDTSSHPSKLWGLAMSTSDLDQAAALLGDRISAPKPAVQPGRRIATVRTRDSGITPTIALMTPHV